MYIVIFDNLRDVVLLFSLCMLIVIGWVIYVFVIYLYIIIIILKLTVKVIY